MIKVFLVLLFTGAALIAIAGFLPFPSQDALDKNSSFLVTIYVSGNGAHTDFILPARTPQMDWSTLFPLPEQIDEPAENLFVVIGWGQREFYMTTPTWNDLHIGTAFRAALGAEPALRVDYVQGLRPTPSLRSLSLTPESYEKLVLHIVNTARRDNAGNAIRIDHPGYTSTDAFYESVGMFSLLRTCNTWTSEGLQLAGQPTPLWTPLEYFVLWHLPE